MNLKVAPFEEPANAPPFLCAPHMPWILFRYGGPDFSAHSLMGLHAVNPLIGPAERAERRFDILHDGIRDSLLTAPGVSTDRAQFADSGQ